MKHKHDLGNSVSIGFRQEELQELLDGYYYNDLILSSTINDFEFDPRHIVEESQGLCFISISNDRWNKEHGKKTTWKDGNKEILAHFDKCALIITEKPIIALKDATVQLIVKNSFEVLTQLATAARSRMTHPVIGITGSVGKSSMRLMLEHLLEGERSVVATRGNHNTQTGVPLYGAKLARNPDVGILEISLNALNNRGNKSLIIAPDICIVTSIGEAHLSTLDSVSNIARFKARIMEGLQENGLALICKDIGENEFNILYKAAEQKTNRIKIYSLDDKTADIYVESIIDDKYKTVVKVQHHLKAYEFTMSLPSQGAIVNALGALLCLSEMGYSFEELLYKMADFKSLDRVMELKKITTNDNRIVDIIDDSHNAAIPSMINAIKTFEQKQKFYNGSKILVLGQIADLGDKSEELHQTLLSYILSSGANVVFGHGLYMRKIIRQLPAKLVGGWFTNAKDLSRRIPFYCEDDSLIILKGSVSGSDFRLTSHLLPAQLIRSKKALIDCSSKSLASVLQPLWAMKVYDLQKEQIMLTLGHTTSQAIDGLAPIVLLYLLLEKGMNDNKEVHLQNWATNDGASVDRKLIQTNNIFTLRELLDILYETQHPSAIYELANNYYKKRNDAMHAIVTFSAENGINPSAVLNLTGRYRVKEQQAYTIKDLAILGKLLSKYKDRLPLLMRHDTFEVRGVIFGTVRKSCIVFMGQTMITMIGFEDKKELMQCLIKSVNQSFIS